MTEQSTILDFLDALGEALEARDGMAGVDVFTAHPGNDLTRECVVFVRLEGSQEPGTMGINPDEDYSATGFVYIAKPGKGESIAKEVRDRAKEIWAEIADELRTNNTVNGTVGHARTGSLDLNQGFGQSSGRWAEIQFEIVVISML